jgi:hypothetical protein
MTVVVALPSIAPDSGEAKSLRVTRLNRTIILRLISSRCRQSATELARWTQRLAGVNLMLVSIQPAKQGHLLFSNRYK